MITPVVVWGIEDAVLRPDPQEVAEVYLLPLEELTPESVVLQPGPEPGRPVLALSLPPASSSHPPPPSSINPLKSPSAAAIPGWTTYEQPRFAWR